MSGRRQTARRSEEWRKCLVLDSERRGDGVLDVFAMPADAKNKDEAYQFLITCCARMWWRIFPTMCSMPTEQRSYAAGKRGSA